MKTIILALLAVTGIAFSQPRPFNYLPSSTTNAVVHHSQYTLSYSEKHEQAEWVSYELTEEKAAGGFTRTNNFREDPLVKTGSAALSDYQASGYDRGHLAPAADMAFSAASMSESFFMSNMSPQAPSFNRGIWRTLEARVRAWAAEYQHIYVVTGPILSTQGETIGENKVSVPAFFYKVVLDYTEPDIKVIALVLPNEKGNGRLQQFVVSVDSLEVWTGIDFFPGIPDEQEDLLENKPGLSGWNFGASSTPSTNIKKGQSSPVAQCRGLTKAGKRCRNKTRNSNGYCHIHGK